MVGKTQISVFCLQYISYISVSAQRIIKELEQGIRSTEHEMTENSHSVLDNDLKEKKDNLPLFLRENVKEVLVRSCFTSLKDMDAPGAFFFNIEKSIPQLMACLHLPDDKITTKRFEMQHCAVEIYSSEEKREL